MQDFYTTALAAPLAGITGKDMTRLVIWSCVLIGILVVAMVIVSKVKRRLQQADEPVSAGFTLSDLRQLHKSGQMSDEEFERAKQKVVEAAKRAAERQDQRERGSGPAGRRDRLT